MARNIIPALAALLLSTGVMQAQDTPRTQAELSGYQSTSLYSDVTAFIDQLRAMSGNIRVESIGTSTEGRDIPLLVIARPVPDSPEALASDPRVVVYIQANIHAGEVEGKEASLMFARDILKEKNSPILDHVILLICPVFNPDGNEKISTRNRTDQNGPANGVGVRYNGQLLDLNRDAVKAESPEMRGLLENVFNRWDPAVFMDCHTTNGSYHVEPVTFTWMVNPNSDNSLIRYLRDTMMPAVSDRLKSKYKVENCFYGEFNDMLNPEKGWYMDAAEPRYVVNYYGLRNRFGILNENYIYADFRSRVLGCYSLIRSLLEYASANHSEIRRLIFEADRRAIERNVSQTDSFAVEYSVRPAPRKVTIKTYEAEFESETDGWKRYRKTDRQKTVTVPYFIDYYPLRSVSVPYAYLVTVRDPVIADLLRRHGILVEKLGEEVRLDVERYEIAELHGSGRLTQGHYMNKVRGQYVRATADFPAGTLVIKMSQPLSRLAACLLEPESDDGMLTWNYFDRYLVPQWGRGFNPYPVSRVADAVTLKTVPYIPEGN